MKEKYYNIVGKNPYYPYLIRYIKEGKNRYKISKLLNIKSQTVNANIKDLVKNNIINIEKKNNIRFSKNYLKEVNETYRELIYFEDLLHELIKHKKNKKLVIEILNFLYNHKKVYEQNIKSELLDSNSSNINSDYNVILVTLEKLFLIKRDNNFIVLTRLGKNVLNASELSIF